MELLAPAGSQEALVAAVQSGANAVYMGFGTFNARRHARNFSEESFLAAVRYSHARGVRVYLTLNTLITDREMPALVEAAQKATAFGVDAILVQDLGVLETLRRLIPDTPLHASTQMSIHTRSGVQMAEELGMQRVVLARELSGEDIACICRDCQTEIEVFVHGALCMCYSGQCEMSALIGRRSGNRGACAQPCRLPYGLQKADSYPLSLKDYNLSQYLNELSDMGVACIKIEGRMKRPEYVAAVVSIYAKLLRERRTPNAAEKKMLQDAFSRSGFTDGYYQGKTGSSMFGVRPDSERWPEEWFAQLRQEYEKETLRRIPLDMCCKISAGSHITLTLCDDDGHSIVVTGSVPEKAIHRSLRAEELEARLRKTGGTPFCVRSCETQIEDGLSVSAAAINALRRDALEQIENLRCTMPQRRCIPYAPPTPIKNRTVPPEFTVSVADCSQLSDELLAMQPAIVYLPIEKMDDAFFAQYRNRAHFCAVLPRIYRSSDEAELHTMLQYIAQQDVVSVAVGNLGHFELVKKMHFHIHADYSMNVYNSAALRLLQSLGAQSAALSVELRAEQIRDLQKPIDCEAIVYGRLPLMIMENCVRRNLLKNPCSCTVSLTDRRSAKFPLLCAYGCRNELQNSNTLYLADEPIYRQIGLRYARLRFTTEPAARCAQVLEEYRSGNAAPPPDFTRGLIFRGVEE